MSGLTGGAFAVVALLLTGCASALHAPAPLVAPSAMSGRGRTELMAEASAAWAQRPELAPVERADALFSEAAMIPAEAGDRGDALTLLSPLIGALRAKAWIVQHDKRAERRDRAAVSAVDAALWCRHLRPKEALCDYWLGIAIGMQARERPSTGVDAMKEMDAALRRAIAAEPGLEGGGPHRVRALLLLRAPSWPLGIGDVDEGLVEARLAMAEGPDHPHNHLVLAEALAATDDDSAARAAFTEAITRARAWLEHDPEAADWIAEAEAGLADLDE